MPTQIVDLRVKVKINGEEPRLQFHSIEVHQRLFEPSRFRLEIGYGSEREQGGLSDKVGGDLVIEIYDAVSNAIAQKHAGRITGFELSEDSIILEARSKDYLMTAGRRHRTFEKNKISDVVQKIAGEHGLSCEVEATTEQFAFLQQYGETDYEFITRLASYCGYAFYHDWEKFYFVKDFENADAVSVDAGDLMDVVKHCRVEDVVKKSAAYYNAELHNDPGKGEKSAKNFAPEFKEWKEVFPESVKDEDFNTDLITPGALASYVDANAARVASEFERVLGSTINPLVVVGRVAESDDAILKKGHVVIGIDAAFRENGYKANFEARQKKIPISPEPSEVDHSLILQRAVVTNDRDEEKKMGRVKVKFAWSAGDESYWAGVLAAGASGDKHGSHFTPRVGDVVLVGFENGDLSHPVVLGSLYTSESPPDFMTTNGREEVLLVQTPNSAIRVVDEDSKETITITMKETKNVIKLELQGPKITVQSDGGNITLKAKTITIDADDKIEMSANNIELKAQQNLTCKAGSDFKAEGMNATLSGSVKAVVSGAQVEASASATNTIKGALVQIN